MLVTMFKKNHSFYLHSETNEMYAFSLLVCIYFLVKTLDNFVITNFN